MANNSTQRYLDVEKSNGFLSGLLKEEDKPKIAPLSKTVEVDIDVDIEKQIAQLQEARINGTLESKEDLSVDPDKQLKEWQLENEFSSFLDNVGKEKEKTERNIQEEEKKISALEGLLGDLTKLGKPKKRKKEVLMEPEKVKPIQDEVKQVILRQPEKIDRTKDKEEVTERYIKSLIKDEVIVDENARKLVADKYGELKTNFPISRNILESDPDIISKVEAQIREMKYANELEKDKITNLRSIDTLEKLTREFLNFKNVTSLQMSTIGGGGSVNVLDSDDIDDSDIANEKILEYNSSTGKLQFVAQGGGTGNVTIPDGGTIGSASDTDAITIDASGNVTIGQNLTVSGTTTTIDSNTINITDSFVFEGSTADAHETTLNVVDPTGDRTITLPNVSGNVPVLAAASTTQITSTPEELNLVDGITAGTISASLAVIVDSNKDITGFRNVTLTGELDAATGDFSGDVDIDGTLEADAITVNGTTLAEFISDTTGAMFSSNTETGITATYQDGDNTIDLAIAAAQTTITSLLATDIKIGEDDQTKIDFETADTINFYAGNEKQLILTDGALTPGADNILDLGSSGVEFKDGYFDGTVTADAFAGPLTGNVTGNASGTAATVTGAAQSNITSLGTLTTLTVDNVITNGTTIGHTDDTDLMTLADGILTVAGEVSMTTLDIGGTNVTATAAELNFSDGVTSNVQTQMDTKTTKGFAIASAIVFG